MLGAVMHAAPSRALLSCLLASCTCGAPADGDSSTPSASSSSSGVGESTAGGTDTGTGGAGTETGAGTTADTSPLEPACPDATVSSGVGERVRRCEVLFEGSVWAAHGLDLDGDGRESVFIDKTSAYETSALYNWVDGELQGGETGVYTSGFLNACQLRWDFDGDGLVDVSCFKTGLHLPLVYPNLGDALGPYMPQAEFAANTVGASILVDPNQDGHPERLISAVFPEDARGFGLFREVDGVMQPHGPRHFLGGCAIPDGAAYGDFDEDGLDDVVVVDSPVGCDWYVGAYDPEFHRVHVFLTRPQTETMDLAASVPTGAIVRWDAAPVIAAEMTGDDHVDIAVALDPPGLAAFMPGRGDGTFENAIVYTATDLGLPDVGGILGSAGKPGETAFAAYFGQFDDDPDPELVAHSRRDRIWVLDDHRHGLAVLEEFDVLGSLQGIADIDGDGIDDLVVDGPLESYLLISQQ